MVKLVKDERKVSQPFTLGYYLDLPSENAKNKSLTLKNIREKVWNTLQRWEKKLFYVREKEIPIKTSGTKGTKG